ncbi:hypothetical protein GGR55DRAFT_560758 [Xylaria sp. FL0064]|nr:hypothetical protein GGR55DRAFT_560758 [Xylaria sp. FL0064]
MEEGRSKHDGLYARILEDWRADGVEPTSDDETYESCDVEQVSVNGFPSIAAYHATYPNTRICRSFDYPNQRLILHYQYQLTCLLGALADLDVESATKSETEGEKGSQPLPFDKEKFISRCLQSPDQISLVQLPKIREGNEEGEEGKKERIEAMRENLLANMERILDKYCSRVSWQNELRNFPRVSAKIHGKFFNMIKKKSGLAPDALDYFRANDDFIYADPDPLYERFHNMIVDIRDAFIKSVRFLSCNRLWADGGGSGSSVWSAQTVRILVRSLMVLSSSALLLPLGILYLKMPRKEVAFLVVALSTLAFGFALTAFDYRMSYVLLALAAYLAVLVVFLSNPLSN